MFKIQVEIRILSVNPNHVILNYSMTNRTDKVLELTVAYGFNLILYPAQSYRMASSDFIRDLNDKSVSRE